MNKYNAFKYISNQVFFLLSNSPYLLIIWKQCFVLFVAIHNVTGYTGKITISKKK